MLRDNLAELIETMNIRAARSTAARQIHKHSNIGLIDSLCLENPRPEGRNFLPDGQIAASFSR